MSVALKLKSQIEIKLGIQKGPHAGQRFSFSKTEITIGRSPENDVVLINDPQISRQHVKIAVMGSDIEVINLSEKNSILVQGEKVQRWKLLDGATFVIGDTEFLIHFDLGHSVVPVKPSQPMLQVIQKPQIDANQQLKRQTKSLPPQQVQNSNHEVIGQPQSPQQIQLRMQQQLHLQRQMAGANNTKQRAPTPNSQKQSKLLSDPKFMFYVVIGVVVIIATYFYLNTGFNKSKKSEEKKSILTYADDVNIKLNSKTEKENLKRVAKIHSLQNSPTVLRAEENFIKGMRDFNLGNYTRAQEFFQVVLNLQPGHELARRHLYLSKVRFDELLKAKLMLGESNYQKHNFRMCESYYSQVLNMLQGRSSDQNYQIASAMAEKCKMAAEGIR
jgi:pSer/pThr/pTyr-binding forkhead associated (FHA) protein